MYLYLHCRRCDRDFPLKEKAQFRQDLIPVTGEYFHRQCPECGNRSEYHVNDVKASQSFTMNVLGSAAGILIMVIVTVCFWNQGYVTNIGLIAGLLIIIASNGSVLNSNTKAFNSYRISASPKPEEA